MARSFNDQMGNTISLPNFPPQRIVSLVPSQTELLFDLGLNQEIVGVTQFCIHPKEHCAAKTKIGGTKNFNHQAIEKLAPDLILGNKEENYQEGIEKLSEQYPVWVSDIITFQDALTMIRSVGEIVGKQEKGESIAQEIQTTMVQLEHLPKIRIAYFIWKKPYMVAAQGTFIDEMLKQCGFSNVFKHLERYPEVTAEQIQAAEPEAIFLSTEPFSFREKHIHEFQTLFPNTKVFLVDGEMFSWYGSRLLVAMEYMKKFRNQMSEEFSDFEGIS